MAKVFGTFTRALRDTDLEKREEYLRRHPGRQRRQGIVPDAPADRSARPCYELKDMRCDASHSHANYNGAGEAGESDPNRDPAAGCGDLDEKMSGVAAPRVEW
jgi:hypothetical protein